MRMQIPRSLDELCDTVNWKEYKVEDWPGLQEVALRSAWIRSYLESPRLRDGDRVDIFLFYLACTGLQKNVEVESSLLQDVRDIFFCDSEFYQPAIHLEDIHNSVDEIFRLFSLDWKDESIRTKLKKMIVDLKQDEAVRTGLKPVFNDFIKSRDLHPSTLQHCILSLL